MRKIIFSIIFILISVSLILTSHNGLSAGTTLRSKPGKLNLQNVKTSVTKNNFFDKKLNMEGDFPNDFTDNGDGTITDRATGLMWEKKGSSKMKSFYSAKKHVKKLNKKKFVGHKDWRIPTVEELYSLLEPNMNQQRYIHPVFASQHSAYWSIDVSKLPAQTAINFPKKLTIDYKTGTVADAITSTRMQGGNPDNVYDCFIRGVRSIE